MTIDGNERVRCLVVDRSGDTFTCEVRERTVGELPAGDVTIRVSYSGLNYKDALALTANGRVVRRYPVVPGIDLAGRVLASSDPRFREGDRVLVTGYELGVSHDGGFASHARVPGDWVVPLPQGLDERQAMALGTAGFTAGLAVIRLEQSGLRPGQGPVLVTGASGGVGSVAVALLAAAGYDVTASTGKSSAGEYLRALGAKDVIDRSEVATPSPRPLESQRWAAAVDPVGGDTLAHVLQTVRYGGSVAVMGLTGGAELKTTVMPFILRGVNLLGIDSVYCPMEMRVEVWQRLARALRAEVLDRIVAREIGLDDVIRAGEDVLAGRVRGRVLVRPD